MRFVSTVCLICCLVACRNPRPSAEKQAGAPPTLDDFQARAKRFGAIIRVPELDLTPEALSAATSNAIAQANAALDALGARSQEELTFDNTIRALDDISYRAGLTANRVGLIKETSQSTALRDAATEAIKVFEEWAVGLDYREDVYAAVKAYADRNPKLKGEDARLLEEILRDYRRAGLQLPKEEREEVERLRKELSRLSTDFDTNINKAQRAVQFTRAELAGVPETFLNQPGVKTGDDEYTVMANITWHFITVMDNAREEETRIRLFMARATLAKEENVPLLQQILELRNRVAQKLGYATWADYKIEPKMAKEAVKAREFCEDLARRLQPKFDAELDEFREIKVKEANDTSAQIRIWDARYFSNQLKKQKYAVDQEQLRAYFPYERVLEGMFEIYQRIFGLKIWKVEPPYKWVENLELFAVADSSSNEPLGLFYLDMFPREGKYNHFAQFGIIEGKRLSDGAYQRPTVALICNFPAPQPDKPSLLTHQEVETLFHEFGHALHSILTRAKYARFSGTSVPRDFVEAPSQMLENWVWDKEVLDGFAAHYQDPANKIPQRILDQLKAAKLATVASFYRRQLSFALTDLALHTEVKEGVDGVRLSNKVLSEVYLPMPEETAFVAYFGHLTGYDASYYGYAWADSIAADMATVFENAPNQFFDVKAGLRLRKEIYEPGDSRDVDISIQRFLGRPWSSDPFLKTLGLGPVNLQVK